ncbi:MAG: hypothetical protein KKD17_03475 [Nanoarchaeota archaeon]|nr:hypothetical protein [Nanoarchaeota archaeon]
MALKEFRVTLNDIKEKVLVASQQKGDLKKAITSGNYIYDYRMNKTKYLTDRIKKSADDLVLIIGKLHKQNRNPRLNDFLSRVMVNAKFVREQYLEPQKLLPIIETVERDLTEIEKVEELEKEIKDFEKEAAAAPAPRSGKGGVRMDFTLPALPEEIAENIQADVDELQRCFGSGCYRSAIILCGRIIETALHRKYFEVTGNDALEKEPGIGLGKLVARMSEKSIRLDPGLPQQIHFINQVRIFSVHTKQESFAPSQNQAQATMLYTMDVLGKLFSSE